MNPENANYTCDYQCDSIFPQVNRIILLGKDSLIPSINLYFILSNKLTSFPTFHFKSLSSFIN